jgi:hypothetical protein
MGDPAVARIVADDGEWSTDRLVCGSERCASLTIADFKRWEQPESPMVVTFEKIEPIDGTQYVCQVCGWATEGSDQ